MRFLEPLLAKMYISLIPAAGGYEVYGELRKNSRVLKRFERQQCHNLTEVSEQVSKLSRESALSYVILLESEAKQGVLNSCGTRSDVELSSVERVCVEKRWGIYIDKDDLFELQKRYKSVGLDLLFSPYSLIADYFEHEIENQDGLYLLIGGSFLLGVVFKDAKALFGKIVTLDETLVLADASHTVAIHIEEVQSMIKDFYDAKIDETMFIEQLFIADAEHFDTKLENELEETLFVEVEKRNIDLSAQLVTLAEKELL